jgi:hypothetical protein
MDLYELKQRLERRRRDAEFDRDEWRASWRDLSDFILPTHGRFLETKQEANDGRKKHGKIVDGAGEYAATILAAGMHSGLTSQARPWFRLGTPDPDLNEFKPVKLWLEIVERQMRFVFSQSNFYNTMHQLYEELGTFGTGVMAILENFDTVLRCRPYTVGEYALMANEHGVVDTAYRLFWLTARNLIDKFGEENVSHMVRRAYDENRPDERFAIVHVIEPHDGRLKLARLADKTVRSIYYERDGLEADPTILRIEGFYENPLLAPRWRVTGTNIYGHGPGWSALADIKMLQKMQAKGLMALDKQVDPPMVAPSEFKSAGERVNSMPGGITYADELDSRPSLKPLYEVRPDLASLEHKIENVRMAIGQHYYTDLFLMLAMAPKKEMTATEVAERHEEKLLMLGPVLERLHGEALDPAIERAFGVMLRKGLIPDPPAELSGMNLQVTYISLLAQAQKMVATTAIEQAAAFVGNLTAVFPEVRHKFHVYAAVDAYADAVGISPQLIRSDDEAEELAAAEAQALQQQQAMENAGQAAQAAKVLSETDTGGNNALNALLGGPRR